ncbi:hypothetical protein ACFE04_021072 [Oxalis oulophora]
MDKVSDNVTVELLLSLKHHLHHSHASSSLPSPPPPVQLIQLLMIENEKLCNKVIDLKKLLDSKEFEVKRLQGSGYGIVREVSTEGGDGSRLHDLNMSNVNLEPNVGNRKS